MSHQSISDHEGSKYLREIRDARAGVDASVLVDVYEVAEAFNVTGAAETHALKKILLPGRRGKGDRLADLKGAQAAICRAIDFEERRVRRSKNSNTNKRRKK